MKHNLFSFAAWINTDPRRLRVIMLSISISLLLVASALPGNVILAGLGSGGSD